MVSHRDVNVTRTHTGMKQTTWLRRGKRKRKRRGKMGWGRGRGKAT